MIGIVVVSHSRPLAEAAVELARQMGGAAAPAIVVAAGADGGLGTDAVEIASAIDAVATDDGVLVVMDLGSAILSAEMALELRASEARVALSPAPFVEGLVSAVVLAAAGAPLDAVLAEMDGALQAKRAQLSAGDTETVGTEGGAAAVEASAVPPVSGDPDASFEAVIVNPSGLHARPAAEFVRTARRYDAEVRVADLASGAAPVSGGSLLALLALGMRTGARVRISATGPQATEALDALRALVEDGFGEL
ncbi:dihydroxyacetone kinase phosphoryl donor subunit DhaM [Microbacterium sp. CJ88]|uniref:dihydroxyacetone kinase phosphoryl donor subunit DhaM n=1 Tax=Microbacterium sp. CJ88 TaxID=3445672 RepID=UPI003F6568C5